MKINRDYYIQSVKDKDKTLPSLSESHESKKEEHKTRIKKLESQIKAQQKKNKKFRESGQDTIRKIQGAVQEHKLKVLSELKELQTGVISFCEDKNNSDENSSLLIEILLHDYALLNETPELPDWTSYNPPRPWGEARQAEMEKDEEIDFSEIPLRASKKQKEKLEQIAQSKKNKAETERRLWSGQSIKGPKEEGSLRELRAAYIRLARTVHPDRVEDPAQRELATSFMKRVNSAYSNQDAKALFDLEKELILHPFGNSNTFNLPGEAETRISLLTNQLEELKKEFSKLKKSNLGNALGAYEQALKQGYEIIEFAAPELPTMRREVRELCRRLTEALYEKGKKKRFFSWLKRHYFTSSDPFESFESY